MAHRCDISGVSRQNGNRVSHAKNRTKHVFKANVQARKVFVPELNAFVKLKVSTRVLRTIDKVGLIKVLKDNGMTLADIQS